MVACAFEYHRLQKHERNIQYSTETKYENILNKLIQAYNPNEPYLMSYKDKVDIISTLSQEQLDKIIKISISNNPPIYHKIYASPYIKIVSEKGLEKVTETKFTFLTCKDHNGLTHDTIKFHKKFMVNNHAVYIALHIHQNNW